MAGGITSCKPLCGSSLSLMVWQLNCLWSFLLKPTGKLTKQEMVRNRPTNFFLTPPVLAVSRHVCVYNILFCALGFTSGIWLLSSWSSPYFVPIRMRHTWLSFVSWSRRNLDCSFWSPFWESHILLPCLDISFPFQLLNGTVISLW